MCNEIRRGIGVLGMYQTNAERALGVCEDDGTGKLPLFSVNPSLNLH